MTLNRPLLMEAVTGDTAITYHAQDYRNIISALTPVEGVVMAGDLAVSQRAAGANMSVDVAAGKALIRGDAVANQGTYICYSDATVNVPITAANATNPRIDIIVATVYDKQADGGTSYSWNIYAIAGTPAASPVAPTVPASTIVLAQVYVPANGTSILNTGTNAAGGTGSITDKRTLSGVGDVPKWELAGTAGTPQSIPTNSQARYQPNTTVQLIGVTTAGMNTGEVQIVTPGRYMVHFCFRVPTDAASYVRTAYVRLTAADGTTIVRQIAQDATAAASAATTAAGTIFATAGQRMSTWIYQSASASKSLDDSNKEICFSGVWVGP